MKTSEWMSLFLPLVRSICLCYSYSTDFLFFEGRVNKSPPRMVAPGRDKVIPKPAVFGSNRWSTRWEPEKCSVKAQVFVAGL